MENGETPMLNAKDLDVIIRETIEWLDQGENFTYAVNQVLNRYNLNSPEHFSQVRSEMSSRSLLKRKQHESQANNAGDEEKWWEANLNDAVANEMRQNKLLSGEEDPYNKPDGRNTV